MKKNHGTRENHRVLVQPPRGLIVFLVACGFVGLLIFTGFGKNRLNSKTTDSGTKRQVLSMQTLASLAKICSGKDASDKTCWENLFRKTLKLYGVDGALDLIAYAYDTTKAVNENTCHDLTHFIGREAYKIFAKSKSVPVSAKTAYCSYGFYHGVIEGMVEAKKPLTGAKEFCDYIDRAITKEAPDALRQCFHGIGHGAANNHDPRTWGNEESMMGPALTICDEISQTKDEHWGCASGVFHALSLFYWNHSYNLVMRKGDPYWFCRTLLRDEYKETCYRELTSSLGVITDESPLGIVTLINTIPEDAYAFEAMRAWRVPYNGSVSPSGISFCHTVPERLRISCIQAIVRQLIQDGKPGIEVNDALSFCYGDDFRVDEKNACFDFVFYWNGRWNVTKSAKRVCDIVNDTYKGLCYEYIQKYISK